ncbi:SIS domain-containing protein [Candidatus Ponderosibacter sp. Uisw_141_02]|uniref:SIS domain-containing protein n=1 Tax=Candidatus Ponderosibacter sp. Uisw_141_02 TaxID=3231000 RepID=UPI003D5A6546
MNIDTYISKYQEDVHAQLGLIDTKIIDELASDLFDCWKTGKQFFVCGNGGSGSNANHIANDLIYGISKKKGSGIRCHSLAANPATLLCLANDEGYENIFSYQLSVLAEPDDILLVLSGSGNSPNILRALEEAKTARVKSYGILGFDGGKAKHLVDRAIHTSIDDMQVSEDLQMVILHIISKWLFDKRSEI